MCSTVTCQNYFRLPPYSWEALISLKACIKKANLSSLAIVPFYCSVVLFKILASRVFEKKKDTKNKAKRKKMNVIIISELFSI